MADGTGPPCGTYAALQRHYKQRETPCDACKAAGRERAKARYKAMPRTPRDLPPCGTPAAHRRHRKAGEIPCLPCKEAMAAYKKSTRRQSLDRPVSDRVCACGKPCLRSLTRCLDCKREAARAVDHRKRSKRRGAKIGDKFTLQEIAERDGFRCHLCGKKVRMTLSGMHPQGPTIDHLVPVSAGGYDERKNVALAHRQCNVVRNVGGEVQLRLVG